MTKYPLEQAIKEDIGHQSIILFGVLDWGLGHAARSLPVIDALQKAGHTVIIAGEEKTLHWMQREKPDYIYEELPKSDFKHMGRLLISNIVVNGWPMLRQLYFDNSLVDGLVKKTGATIIISDNRFVFRSDKVQKNIYLTHQTTIFHKVHILSKVMTNVHQWFIRRFTTCWIYDDEVVKLAGRLSDAGSLPSYRYIGNHSRFNVPRDGQFTIDVLFLISGPEPQRSIWEKKVATWIQRHPAHRICLIRGTLNPLDSKALLPGVDVIDLADTPTLALRLQTVRVLVSRPGYTTLMDTNKISIPTLWVPTPGQTEQEYLADYHDREGSECMTSSQDDWEKVMPIFLSKYGLPDLVNP